MLLVEGADYTGKTTFCRALTERLQSRGFPHTPQHLSKPGPDFDYYRDYLALLSPAHVWDRFHLSGVAYRRHDDHPCSLSPLKFQLVEAEFRRRCGFTVILWCTNGELARRVASRESQPGDTIHPLERIVHVNDTFEEMVEEGKVDMRGSVYRVDYDAFIDTTAFQAMDERATMVVEHYLEKYSEFARMGFPGLGGVMGSSLP